MRTQLLIVGLLLLTAAPASAEWPGPADTLALALLDSLQTGPVGLRLETDPEAAGRQLWNAYANRDLAKRYTQIEVPGGKSVWPVFKARLVAAADARGLESGSLERALGAIEKQEAHLTTKGQLFPIGAFVARQDGGKVWVIPCLWESGYVLDGDGSPRPVRARHIRIWAFSREDGRQVGYITCK